MTLKLNILYNISIKVNVLGDNNMKVLISMSDELSYRMRSTIPARQRSKVISFLLEKEIERRERALYQCAIDVEKDEQLHQEMEAWQVTLSDGLPNDSW